MVLLVLVNCRFWVIWNYYFLNYHKVLCHTSFGFSCNSMFDGYTNHITLHYFLIYHRYTNHITLHYFLIYHRYTNHITLHYFLIHHIVPVLLLLQTDMTLVVEQQVRGQLRQEHAESVRRSSITTNAKNDSDICTPTHNVMLQLLKDSSVY